MLVSRFCFHDEEMNRAILSNHSLHGICEVTGKNDILIDIEFFYDFFDEVLGLFTLDSDGLPLIDILQDDWGIFASKRIGETIIDHICADLNHALSSSSYVAYSQDIRNRVKVWNDLKDSVLKERRFFSDHKALDSYAYLIPEATLKKKTALFRARILPKDKLKFKKSELGCPPSHLATAGRANPPGIPYLYLCGDEDTTCYEVRAVQLDRICIGRFIIQRDLKIVDFNTKISLFLAYDGSDLSEVVAGKIIIDAIRKDMSRPMRRYDSEIEYVPTQMICEYCKVNGADGICFDSTLHKGGKNYVLFDGDVAKCTRVLIREIKEISIKS